MRNYITKSNEGGAADSITATKLGAGETNSFLTESKTAVSSSDQVLSDASGTSETTDQLAMAMAIYGAGGGSYCVDTGTTNNYVLNPVSPKKAAPALFNGLTLTFVPGNISTGAAVINYNSIGAITVRKNAGFALVGGELLNNTPITVMYRLIGNYFEIVSPHLLTADQTFTVGAAGQFTTMTSAIVFMSKFTHIYQYNGVTITLNMLSGFILTEQIVADGINLGWLRITGDDGTTSINPSAFTRSFDGPKPAFAAVNGGISPLIEQTFAFTGAATADHYGVLSSGAGSCVNTENGINITDAGGIGLYAVAGGMINAPGMDVSGAGSHGARAENCGTINVPNYVANTTGASGLYATNGSTIEANGATISNTIGNGVTCQEGSRVNVSDATILSPGGDGIDTLDGCSCNARNTVVTGAGTFGINVYGGGICNISNGTISGSGTNDISVAQGGIVSAFGATYSTASITPNTLTGNGILFV